MEEKQFDILEPSEETTPEVTPLTDEAENEGSTPDEASAEAVDNDTADDDSALNSFLSREQEQKPKAKTFSRKPLFILIGAILAVAILVTLLIILRSQPNYSAENETKEAAISLDVNADNIHEVKVSLDENGEITQNGTGALMSYVPSQIKTIDVENQGGSFTVASETPSGEATVYKIVGFEDYAIDNTVADEIATHSAALNFTRIIAADGNLADFGLDKPRATVNVAYTDDTSAIIRVGDEAAGAAGTYVAFGTTNDVFLVNNEDVANFLYNVNNLISLDITDTMEDSENAEFSTATISGTRYDDPITLEPNTDDAISSAYIMTEPVSIPANAIEANDIAGNIRGLYAESVVCVNPSEDQMKSYGLDTPYAAIKATYPDTTITLSASSPNDDGTVYVYNPDKNVVYTIQLAAVCWAKTGVDLLMPENPLNVKLRYVSDVDFSAGDTEFSLSVTTKTETFTDDDGNQQESSTSTATYNGKDLSEEYFNVFFQNLTTIKNLGAAEESGKDKVMSVKLRYTTDHPDDTLTVYNSDGSKYILEFNGKTIGTVSKSYINDLIEGADNLIAGQPVAGL